MSLLGNIRIPVKLAHNLMLIHEWIVLMNLVVTYLFFHHFRHSYLSAIYTNLLHRHPGKVRAYHKNIPSDQQTELRTKFWDPESELRVLVCSSSFAMGTLSFERCS